MIALVSSLILGVSLNLRTSEEKHFPLTSHRKGKQRKTQSDLLSLSPSLGQLRSHLQELRASPLTSLMHRGVPSLIAGAGQGVLPLGLAQVAPAKGLGTV